MKRQLSVLLLLSILLTAFVGSTQASPAAQYCGQPTRLYAGGGGRVTLYPNLPNNLRTQPVYYGQIIGQIPAGGTFAVVGGPQCANGANWWQVLYNGITGWTVEGDGGNTYYLEPAGIVPFPTATPQPSPVCVLPNRLTINGYGRVTPGVPNVVRNAPGTNSTGSNSQVIGQIPGGGVFSVQGGPECGSDGRWWWYVNYNGLIGWTAEGEGYGTYWVEPWYSGPVGCPGALPSRLTTGSYGRVMYYPYLPNRIRSAATYSGYTLGYIPPGGTFYIVSGPNCADNTAWWQVSYNGVTGWTAEGGNGTYWLEPM